MPSDRVACPLCAKMVSRLNLGAHFLSRAHFDDFINDKAIKKTLEAYYNSKVVRKEEFDKLPTFYVKNEGFNICLGCKRCYTTDSIRKEKSNHFENHPECCKPFCEALTTLCGPKEVVMTDPEDLQKENDALKAEIARLKKAAVITTPAPIVMSGDSEWKEKYDALLSEKDEVEEECDKNRSEMMAFRKLWKEYLPSVFNGPMDIPLELEEIKSFLEKKNAPPPPEPIKEAPKVNQAKVEAFVAAHIARDWDGQGKIATTMNMAETAEASRRVNEYENRSNAAPAPPRQVAFQPPPVNPPVLTSTRRLLSKSLDREKSGLVSRN